MLFQAKPRRRSTRPALKQVHPCIRFSYNLPRSSQPTIHAFERLTVSTTPYKDSLCSVQVPLKRLAHQLAIIAVVLHDLEYPQCTSTTSSIDPGMALYKV
jgi:hypothetical protein